MFTHLHVHTQYSLLDGHSKISELLARAKELGQNALAITDHGYMTGVIDFYTQAKKVGIKPILGVELYTTPDIYVRDRHRRSLGHITLLAKNLQGYQNLLALSSEAATAGFYYVPRCDLKLLDKYHDGIICLSGCLQGDVAQLLLASVKAETEEERDAKLVEAYTMAHTYKEIFGEDYFIELQYHGLPDQKLVLTPLIELARQLQIQVVATNDVHYTKEEDAEAQRALMCIGIKKTMDDQTAIGYGNPSRFYLKSEAEMIQIFGKIAPEAIANAAKIAEQCNVELPIGEYHLPQFQTPEGWADNDAYFEALCRAGLERRYGKAKDTHMAQLEYEMDVIRKMGFVDYFLIVCDVVSFARKNNIPIGPGRGSAAGSIVSYVLGITDIDPVLHGLVFERFLNPERVTMPDIDIDVDPRGRDMVIQHIVDLYGADHICRIASFSSEKARGSILDAARVLKTPTEIVGKVLDYVPLNTPDTLDTIRKTSKGLQKLCAESAEAKRLVEIAAKLAGSLRHFSTHAAGIVITPTALTDYLPTRKDDKGQVISQFDMASLEQIGVLKIDLLGLRTLSVLDDTEKAVNANIPAGSKRLNLRCLRNQDAAVYHMLAQGKATAVFQLESAGMRDTLMRLKPTCLEDLTAVIALYRPGPMDSIPKFCANKRDPGKVRYLVPQLKPILENSYGTIVYQEQVMQIVRDLAGYSFGRSDIVRRAMSKKKHGVMEAEHMVFIHGRTAEDGTVLVPGCVRNGISETDAETLWKQMEDFAAYAFNKAHAAGYAVLAYRTAFCKHHYPKEYMSAVLSSLVEERNSGWQDKIVECRAECKELGIQILPPSVNDSALAFGVEGDNIRYGLMGIKSVGGPTGAAIAANRASDGPYVSIEDLVARNLDVMNKEVLTALIQSGACDCFGDHTRSEMLAAVPNLVAAIGTARKRTHEETEAHQQLEFLSVAQTEAKSGPAIQIEWPVEHAELPQVAALNAERDALGLYLSGHPMEAYRQNAAKKASLAISDINDEATSRVQSGENVRVAGVITALKEVTTKKRTQMATLTMEDLTGSIAATIFPRTWEANKEQIKEGTAIAVFGKMEKSDFGWKLVIQDLSILEPDNAA